jgi:glycosyltransferase involved in cell wall biosynthesis
MRVAVNAEQLLYHSPGGIGRYTAQILAGVPRLFPDDEVVAFTARHPRRTVSAALRGAGVTDQATILSLSRPMLYEAWLRLGRPRLPKSLNADLVHAPSVAVPPHPAVPLVVTVHDLASELFPESFPRRGRRFHALGLAAAESMADIVLTVSNASAADIAEHTSISADRIRVVHNGVDPMPLDPEHRSRVLRSLGLTNRRYVLWLGSFEPRKGVGTILAAMAELRRRRANPDVHLVIAGYEGWLEDRLVDPADRTTLGDSLRQIGRVNEEELWALYSGALLFAFPSRYEGFGLPVIEAMSQGTPVVASDIDAIREIAGGAARLVSPSAPEAWADTIEELLDDEAERRRLADAGVSRSRELSLDATLRGIRAVYQELAGS